jgi:hypothetical protein
MRSIFKLVAATVLIGALASCGTSLPSSSETPATPPVTTAPTTPNTPDPSLPSVPVTQELDLSKCKIVVGSSEREQYTCDTVGKLEIYSSYFDAVSVSQLLDQGVTIKTRPGMLEINLTGKVITIEASKPGEKYSAFRLVKIDNQITAMGAGTPYSYGYLIVKASRLHLREDMTIEGSECYSRAWDNLWGRYVRFCELSHPYAFSSVTTNAITLAKMFDSGVYSQGLLVGWTLQQPAQVTVAIQVIETGYAANGDYTPAQIFYGDTVVGVVIREGK